MKEKKVSVKGPLSARASAIAESEGMTLDEVIDYALRRFVDRYEFDEEPEEDEEAEEDDEDMDEADSNDSDGEDEDRDDEDEEPSAVEED
jgi:hypothetical protein